jgi:hypothetical protein
MRKVVAYKVQQEAEVLQRRDNGDAAGEWYIPPFFRDCRIQRTLSLVFVTADYKRVRRRFFGTADSTGVMSVTARQGGSGR